jgi:hypothetical protein
MSTLMYVTVVLMQFEGVKICAEKFTLFVENLSKTIYSHYMYASKGLSRAQEQVLIVRRPKKNSSAIGNSISRAKMSDLDKHFPKFISS